jgi:hypothetical protein
MRTKGAKMDLPVIQRKMIEEFQCPGCICGSDILDGCYEPDDESFHCKKHTAGTMIVGRGCINLGMPKGFNRLSIRHTYNNIRLFEKYEDHPGYDHLNVPVWAMQKTENEMDILFVRCYLPRVDCQFVDVILNGKLEDVQGTFPNVIDVSTFIDEID